MSFNAELNKEIEQLNSTIPDVEIETKLKLDSWVTPEDFAKMNGTKNCVCQVKSAKKGLEKVQNPVSTG